MEGYTFRCEREDCVIYRKTIDGVTMGHVIQNGGPICQSCGDDLELVGPDDGADAQEARIDYGALHNPRVTATESRIIAEEAAARIGLPKAYSPVPGPPVNPRDAQPAS